jgi:hypothetical protein
VLLCNTENRKQSCDLFITQQQERAVTLAAGSKGAQGLQAQHDLPASVWSTNHQKTCPVSYLCLRPQDFPLALCGELLLVAPATAAKHAGEPSSLCNILPAADRLLLLFAA